MNTIKSFLPFQLKRWSVHHLTTLATMKRRWIRPFIDRVAEERCFGNEPKKHRQTIYHHVIINAATTHYRINIWQITIFMWITIDTMYARERRHWSSAETFFKQVQQVFWFVCCMLYQTRIVWTFLMQTRLCSPNLEVSPQIMVGAIMALAWEERRIELPCTRLRQGSEIGTILFLRTLHGKSWRSSISPGAR